MLRKLALSALLALSLTPALAQSIQLAPGEVIGNSTAAQRPGTHTTVTLLLDRALNSNQGSVLNRGAGGWASTRTPVLGLAGTAVGSIGFQNATSGTVTLQPVTGALGTPTINIPAASGTMAVSATAPIALSAAGAISFTGPLSLALGGTNNNLTAVNGGLVWSDTTKMNISAAMTANQIMIGGGAGAAPSTFACATTTTLVHGGTPPTCTQVVFADIASAAIATSANYLSGAASVLVPASVIYTAETTTTFGATTTFDFSTFINTAVTLTGNITTMTLSNVTAGKAGTIRFIQDGTGSRTSVFNTIFKFPAGTIPTLTTTINAQDFLNYNCISATICQATLNKDVRNP